MESFAAKRVLIIGGGFAGRTRRLVISWVFWIASIHNASLVDAQSVSLDPAKMQRIGTIDERFQSYNIEMLEVTGGKFWRPYSSLAKPPSGPGASSSDTPAGMDPSMYEYRPPVNLANARLRKLAAALGPAYVRVSGTWANTTYFPEWSGAGSANPTRRIWRCPHPTTMERSSGLLTGGQRRTRHLGCHQPRCTGCIG